MQCQEGKKSNSQASFTTVGDLNKGGMFEEIEVPS